MAECELMSAEEQLMAENTALRLKIRHLTEDIERGFMKGTYARLCELQEIERKWGLRQASNGTYTNRQYS